MKIGVISDTHIYDASADLPEGACDILKGCDLILHAGDLIDLSVMEKLSHLSRRVKAVHGNMDKPEVIKKLSPKLIVNAGQCRIGLVHGYGPPQSLAQFVREQFPGKELDCIVFGHSHMPMNESRKGVLYFNPGSPTDKIFAAYNSVGILTVAGKSIRGEIIRI